MRIPIREYWRLLARYLLPHRRLLIILAVLLGSGIGVRLLAPWFAAWFLDDVTQAAQLADRAAAQDRFSGLLVLAALFCVAGIVDQLLVVGRTHLGSHIAWQATNQLREDVVDHCLRLDMGFHQEHAPGAMVERVDGDVRQLNNFFSAFALRLVVNLLLITGAIAVMLWVDWRIGLVFVGFTMAALWLLSRVHGIASPYWRRARAASAQLYGDVEERFGGLPDIRANGAGGYVHRRFAVSLRDVFHRNRIAMAVSTVVGMGTNMALVLGGIAVLGAAVGLYVAGTLSIGTVFAMSMYTAIISGPLRQILRQIDDLQRATASIGRVQELLSTRPTIEFGPGAGWTTGAVSLAATDVSFAYSSTSATGTSPSVLRDVSFRLRSGEVLGLIGRTGAGKSTIVRLLLRFYDPTAGRITLDGVDLRQATQDELRTRVGVVTQEVQLFHTTLRDNLTLFDDRLGDEQLVALLRDVGLGRWFDRQPQGLDTVLASGGGGMSAGEAQLLGVARVFLTDPGLVILDEPTSRLDPVTEALVDRAFDRLFVGRTGVIVAHRLHTVHRVDKIMVLDGGRVAEYGPRAELAADPHSAYHRALILGSGDIDEISVLPASEGGRRC